MQRPSLDTLPPLSDPIGTGVSPLRFQTPAPQASPGLRGFFMAQPTSSQPIPGGKEILQPGLRTTRLGLVAIFEAHPGRQAHQDAFGAPAGLQAEQGAAI